MTWTSPRTWVDGETPTGALFNAHLSDNMAVLKVSRDDLGRVRGLTSSYVADLDGTSLTGLAKTGASNAFTAARHRFNSGLLRVPVGADKYATDGGLPTPGSLWVEGNYLHHIDASRIEWRYLGTVISSPGALSGFVMIASAGLRYTDASGVIRECVSSSAQHTDAAALGGSLWVQSSYVNWVAEAGSVSYQGHQDVSHADHSDHADHTDHTDTGSSHQDTAHDDSSFHVDHQDGPIPFGHADHTDHTDSAPHADHTDHTDVTTHSDATPHSDVAEDMRPVLV